MGRKVTKKNYKAPKKFGGGGHDKSNFANVSTNKTQGDSLILYLDSTKLWIVGLGASFHCSPNKMIKSYTRGDFERCIWETIRFAVLLEKGDVDYRLPNASSWKLKDVIHVSYYESACIVRICDYFHRRLVEGG